MQNCRKCAKRKFVKTTKWDGEARVWKCFFCGNEQAEDQPFHHQKPKVLYLDTEVSLSEVYNFGLQVRGEYISPDFLKKPYYIICWSASWVGSKEVFSGCVTPTAARKWTDKQILSPIWKLMDEADVIAGHNIMYDIKRLNTRFLINGMMPPLTYKTSDTLKTARSKFKFESNKLDHICTILGLRPKDAMSKDDWIAIADNGDEKTLAKMQKYNAGDVREGKKLLEMFDGWTGTRLDYGAISLPKLNLAKG